MKYLKMATVFFLFAMALFIGAVAFAQDVPRMTKEELKTMIAATNLSKGLFHANHASNYLPIKARLPKDKEATLKIIEQALSGKVPLKPEYLRAL